MRPETVAGNVDEKTGPVVLITEVRDPDGTGFRLLLQRAAGNAEPDVRVILLNQEAINLFHVRDPQSNEGNCVRTVRSPEERSAVYGKNDSLRKRQDSIQITNNEFKRNVSAWEKTRLEKSSPAN